MEMIRAALASSGVNMAEVTLGGATRCTVTRPIDAMPESLASSTSLATEAGANEDRTRRASHGARSRNDDPRSVATAASSESTGSRTLRDAVVSFFNSELSRYGGTADIVFDRTEAKVLDLSGPAYDFRVRRGNGPALGLIPLAIDVVADGRVVQSVPMVVQVSMIRRVVIAGRPINQDATIRAADVEVVAISFTRLDKLGFGEPAQVIGQRAKRFIAAGSTIEPTALESVPLVARGQIVTLTAVEGAVRIVTTASAMKEGRLGETITVRSADHSKVEFDAVIVGPAAVQIGGNTSLNQAMQLAAGGAR